jgi:hypothetical protein
VKRTPLYKLVTAALALTLLLTHSVGQLPSPGVKPAAAAGLGLNAVVGFIRYVGAVDRRIRTYREGAATANEVNEYYGRLIAQAQITRRDMIARSVAGDADPVLARSYVRIEAALKAEQAAAIQMIEAEKNRARKAADRARLQAAKGVLVASPGAQKIIGQIRETIGRTREAAVAVRAAADSGRPIQALGDALAKQVGDIPVAQEVARELGSAVGRRLDRALGGVLSKVERAVDDVQGEMGQAIDLMDQFDSEVARVGQQERSPVSTIEGGAFLGAILPVDRANPVIDVAAGAFAGAAQLSGRHARGASRADMRDRIRGALLEERLAGISRAKVGGPAGTTYCTDVDRAAYQEAALQLGQTLEVAPDPDRAHYWACYDIQTQAAVSARMLGSAAGQAQAPPSEPDESAAADPELSPAETSAAESSDVDMCALLPLDESLVNNRGNDFCVASFDALVGCGVCGCSISVVQTESVERAQFVALDTRCGNPNFDARGDSPIGDVGVTCTNITGEEYRPGVAQGYLTLAFSYGRYTVSIHTGYPGLEELVVSLGQEVIDRIDRLPSVSN